MRLREAAASLNSPMAGIVRDTVRIFFCVLMLPPFFSDAKTAPGFKTGAQRVKAKESLRIKRLLLVNMMWPELFVIDVALYRSLEEKEYLGGGLLAYKSQGKGLDFYYPQDLRSYMGFNLEVQRYTVYSTCRSRSCVVMRGRSAALDAWRPKRV